MRGNCRNEKTMKRKMRTEAAAKRPGKKSVQGTSQAILLDFSGRDAELRRNGVGESRSASTSAGITGFASSTGSTDEPEHAGLKTHGKSSFHL